MSQIVEAYKNVASRAKPPQERLRYANEQTVIASTPHGPLTYVPVQDNYRHNKFRPTPQLTAELRQYAQDIAQKRLK